MKNKIKDLEEANGGIGKSINENGECAKCHKVGKLTLLIYGEMYCEKCAVTMSHIHKRK